MNLIITCARHLEEETKQEISDILVKFGDPEPEIEITKMPGILLAHTKLDEIQTIQKITKMLLDEPWSIRYCLRVIPIQRVIETDLSEIEKESQSLGSHISKNDTYRIVVEKRNSGISSQEIITRIASKIKNKVSLEKPDKIILIEILGSKTGISIIKKSNILSVEKSKRSISE